ncbi:MAG: MGMT family protein [Candidatus Aenigmarchaeota archaeon]|nr:MGMT family protein [Candidatus Aenigmarchaeota archaeon]
MTFQEKVWELLKQIPKGRVTTYKIISHKLDTKAYRTVGNACHNNPFAPKVPCHRVVNSSGKVGGFATGIENKIKLLEKEGIKIKNNQIQNFEEVLFKLKPI